VGEIKTKPTQSVSLYAHQSPYLSGKATKYRLWIDAPVFARMIFFILF